MRPLHIQDWKPSAKEEGLRENMPAGGRDGAQLLGHGQGGLVATPCLAEEVLPG